MKERKERKIKRKLKRKEPIRKTSTMRDRESEGGVVDIKRLAVRAELKNTESRRSQRVDITPLVTIL